MRTYLAIPFGAMVVGMMLLGGCASKAELDEAKAQCRRANDELKRVQEALAAMRADNQRLSAELQARDAALSAKDKEMALLSAERDKLKRSFDDLKALYDKKGLVLLSDMALPKEMDEALRALVGKYPDLLEYDPKLGMIKFKSDMTFDLGSDQVKPAAQEALAKFVEIMNSAEAKPFNIYIAGHTDDIPILKGPTLARHPNNWYLSVHRAVSVLQVMHKAGLENDRAAAMGFGEYHPIAPNAPGHKGNALNRRVEIWIVPADKFMVRGMEGAAAEPPPAKEPVEEKAPAAKEVVE